ncbi:probable peptidoglycan muropeptide transporter SLC46 [Prorops nasuta]|uniref:probable peptidoglycan muropeptide transporter SLC46 n=1 Tax=Prorops nasuta TaxID=863751 RepID=UPI0034CEBC09
MTERKMSNAKPSPLEREKNEKNEKSEKKAVLEWKSMTWTERFKFFTSNITVEPMVAFFVIPSVLASLATQNLNLEKACRVNLKYSDEACTALAARNTTGYEKEEIAVQQLVAQMQTWKTALQSGIPPFLILFIGAWSDRTGLRKPCMLAPIVGEFITSVCLIACTYWFVELPLEAAGVSEALFPALAGGWFTMFMGIFSYIADITSEESRTLRIGAANVFLSLGVPIGMALSGVLYVKIGFYGVFAISSFGYILSFFYGVFVIKEPPRQQQQLRQKDTDKGNERKVSIFASAIDFFSFRHIEDIFRAAFREGTNNRKQRIIVLMIVTMVVIGPMYGEMSVMYLFVRYRFNWNEVQFSMWSTYGMVTNLIGTSLSVGVLSHYLKMDDALVGVLSCISKILAGFVYAFARTDTAIYLAALVEIINGTSLIAVRSITSKLIPSEELGKVNSLFGVCESLMPLVYGPMYSAIYRATMDTFPGTFFIVGGVMTMPAVLMFFWLYTENRKERLTDDGSEKESVEKITDGKKTSQSNGEKPTTYKIDGIDNAAFESEH